MTIKREFDAEFLNRVVNDPAVKPGARITEEVDLSGWAGDYRNFVLRFENGCFVLLNKGDGTYEIHTLVLKEGRGEQLRGAIPEMFAYMFFQTDCERITTIAHHDNPAAQKLAQDYMTCRGETDDYRYYDLHYSDWILTCPIAREAGERFHGMVESNHGEDVCHDFQAGGAVILIQMGNVTKALKMYNHWAKMSGYSAASVLARHPLIVQIGDMKITYHNYTLEQICQ